MKSFSRCAQKHHPSSLPPAVHTITCSRRHGALRKQLGCLPHPHLRQQKCKLYLFLSGYISMRWPPQQECQFLQLGVWVRLGAQSGCSFLSYLLEQRQRDAGPIYGFVPSPFFKVPQQKWKLVFIMADSNSRCNVLYIPHWGEALSG